MSNEVKKEGVNSKNAKKLNNLLVFSLLKKSIRANFLSLAQKSFLSPTKYVYLIVNFLLLWFKTLYLN